MAPSERRATAWSAYSPLASGRGSLKVVAPELTRLVIVLTMVSLGLRASRSERRAAVSVTRAGSVALTTTRPP